MTLPTSGPRLSRWLHKLFEATLLVKGSLAASEALAGLGLLVTANHVILSLVGWLLSLPLRSAERALGG